MNSQKRISAIQARLGELGADIHFDPGSRVDIRFKFKEHFDSHWIEIGFLLGQWASLVGINFPDDFPYGEVYGVDTFRFDVDPQAMSFRFKSPR